MRQSVFILATVRNPALLDAARLVFRTLRVGFPNAEIAVTGNALECFAASEVHQGAQHVDASFSNCMTRLSHDAWIEALVNNQSYPFWICDTDVVFFDKVESWFEPPGGGIAAPDVFGRPVAGRAPAMSYAGRFEPWFVEQWTKAERVARLHTALMYIDPIRVRMAIREWMGKFPMLFHTAQMNLIRQHFVPVLDGHPLFYDTMAGLFQAGYGTPFSITQNCAFEHLHCGTYADVISRAAPSLADLQKVHKEIYQDPARARGLQEKQARYYASRAHTHLVVEPTAAHIEQGE